MTERARKFGEKLIEAARLGGIDIKSVLWDGRVRLDILADCHDRKNVYLRESCGGYYIAYTLENIKRSRTFMTDKERSLSKQ